MSDSPVGVVGDPAVADRLREAGVPVTTGTVDSVPTTERVVTVGEPAVRAVAAAATDPLVVPVAAGRGVRSVSRDDVATAVAGLDEAVTEHHPLFEVSVAGEDVGTVVFDVTAVTAEAARISEYAVETTSDSVGRFRADGVTLATPAGSPGYARRIGGPVIAPAESVGVVAPIAPFQVNPDHWVVSLDGLSVSVERDEATVALYADGDEVTTVACGETARLQQSGALRVAVLEASCSRFH
ncbi:ATP-NAD kinase [Haloarcula salinisoli]|uniref:ATP-NAD kinase n=1 Tax=Haloarcula salinisoli TaxID=2487746 RepID=A0A8J7YC04_9EURY|nr:ATP-NAD kinase [Halomicroarcula salinisoli]MBX0285859.1 ATP-NAD kinase [Halomicroarcula salinisoli]MBX0302647.1 ATP-NAD kinase [Halomicroarcula salinisoli]